MKILILSTPNPYKTAGIAAKDLLESLNTSENITARLVVKNWGNYKDDSIIAFESFTNYSIRWIVRKTNNVLRRVGLRGINSTPLQRCNPDYRVQDYFQTKTYFTTAQILNKADFTPDIIIVLFMQNFLSFENLFELNRITKAPIFLYMMDMAQMTGLCHYAVECVGYTKKCGCCPALYSNDQNDQTRLNFWFKKKNIDRTNIFPIAASEWQFRQLDKSSLFKNKKKFKVLLSINDQQYCPTDKFLVRKQLCLPSEKKIIFFRAVSFSERRKGPHELLETLNILHKSMPDPLQIHLAIVGVSNSSINNLFPFSYTLLGYLDHNNLHKAFQAADVFISPSIEDSGPMMVNQSIMCGTPVVAFEMGVALDLVSNGVTGYRAKLKDNNELAEGLKLILELKEQEYKIMSLKCREIGLSLCHRNKKVKEMINIFSSQLK